eukprot:2812549-Pyramimonas_sp.AAC.1
MRDEYLSENAEAALTAGPHDLMCSRLWAVRPNSQVCPPCGDWNLPYFVGAADGGSVSCSREQFGLFEASRPIYTDGSCIHPTHLFHSRAGCAAVQLDDS